MGSQRALLTLTAAADSGQGLMADRSLSPHKVHVTPDPRAEYTSHSAKAIPHHVSALHWGGREVRGCCEGQQGMHGNVNCGDTWRASREEVLRIGVKESIPSEKGERERVAQKRQVEKRVRGWG